MDIKKEYKFALPTSLGLLVGVLTGALGFYLIVGTIFGLVWGYSDHMLMGSKSASHKSSTKKKTNSSRKSFKRKKK